MMSKSITTLAFAAGCMLAFGAMPSAHAQVVTNGPVASRGDFGEWSPRLNVIESARYDRLLETNMAFRAHRMRQECGPITLPELRERCLASFAQYEPAYGRTAPSTAYNTTYGTSEYGGGYGEMGVRRNYNYQSTYPSTLGAGETYNSSTYSSTTRAPAPMMPGQVPPPTTGYYR